MWFSPRAVGLHVIVVVLTPAFILLFLWQVRRATSGNTLSWAYVFEWPFFLGYLLYMWWRLVHEPTTERPEKAGGAAAVVPAEPAATDVSAVEPAAGSADEARPPVAERAEGAERPARQARTQQAAERDDEDLAAYNRYLAELNASGHSKRW